MSRVISAVCIALFVSGVCIASVLYSSYFTDDITEQTKEIYEGNTEKIEEMREKWEEYNEVAAFYYNHEELERITVLADALSECDSENDVFFRMYCREIEAMMEHMKESQLPKLNNIF